MSDATIKPEPVEPPGWPRPMGYSNGMLVPAGAELLFVAGQVGWDTEQRFPESFIDQFRQALTNVKAVVSAADAGPESIASMTIYVTDKQAYLEDLRAIGNAWREVLGRVYPSMALVEVSALVEDAAKVEIQAIAAIKEKE